MSEVTRILSALDQGDPHAAETLLPLVYSELRRLAAQKLSHEKPGQTLQATALVHEAYLRLLGPGNGRWENRRHFFAAAAEAMRRILVENARRKKRGKHGGDMQRIELDDAAGLVSTKSDEELLVIDEALTKLAEQDPKSAEIVKLRFFAGLSVEEAGRAVGISRSSAYEQWTYAKAWLRCELNGCGDAHPS